MIITRSNFGHWASCRPSIASTLCILGLVYIFVSCSTLANRVSEKIYAPLQSNHYCSRRLNATHQMGCTSDLGGNLGVVWIVNDQRDLDHVLKQGPTPPYMVVVRREQYTRKNLIEFKANPERVSGVVFIDQDTSSRSMPFSPEYTCPNRYSGLYVNDTRYADCRQNHWQEESPISGLLYDDIPYPIFLINKKESIDELESCFKENHIVKGNLKVQDTYPLCSMQLDSFMLAASNTGHCLNSRSLVNEIIPTNSQRCVTVENNNIFAYYKPTSGALQRSGNETTDFIYMTPDTVKPQSVVMLVAKLSSLSMFSEISPGADSTITSIVTLLAVAEALRKVRDNSDVQKSERNIVFALFDSEPFDYTGSSRMVYDMEAGACPFGKMRLKKDTPEEEMKLALQNLNLSSIDYILNLDQMANYPNTNKIYLHIDPDGFGRTKLDRVVNVLERTASEVKVEFEKVHSQLPLPPTSVQEFIKQSQSYPEDKKLLGAVLSNYDKTYSNLFYHSIYDDSHNIYQTNTLVQHITQVASFVAKSLYQLAFKLDKTNEIVVNQTLVEEMLECYMKHANCSLFTEAMQAGQQLPDGSIQTYKDSSSPSSDMNGAITKNLLAYFIGDKFNYSQSECMQLEMKSLNYTYDYINGRSEPVLNHTSGTCIRSQVFMTRASSPSFTMSEGGEIIVDQRFPAWTISSSSIRNPVRIYMKPSPLHQWCIFLMGIVVTAMAFIIVQRLKATVSQINKESETGTLT